jgi:elongation of very long chain fatty acids protein 6
MVNALIHSFMYTYYFLMSIGIKPSWAKALTLGQISQMVVGIGIIGWYYFKTSTGGQCHCTRPDLLTISCAIMYGSYLFLFTRFYFQRYGGSKDKKNVKEE